MSYIILCYDMLSYIKLYSILLYYVILYFILYYLYMSQDIRKCFLGPAKMIQKPWGTCFFCFVFSPRSSQRGGKHSHCSPVIHGESPKEVEVLCIIGAFSHGYVSLLEFKMGILWSILRRTRRLPVTDLAYPLTNPFVGSLFLMSTATNLKQ